MTGTVFFDPLVPWVVLGLLAAMSAAACAVAVWRGLSGWWLRALGALAVLAVLSGPAWQVEDRAPLSDIVLMIEDRSASQRLSDRADQTTAAAEALAAAIGARDNTELRRLTVGDAEGDGGTQIMSALTSALAKEPLGRIAGVFVISDGQVHDMDLAPALPAPLHLLHTGREEDWDRRLIVKNAPAFAIIGEEVILTLRVEDQGNAPAGDVMAPIDVAVGGEPSQRYRIRIGEDVQVPVTLQHGGLNVIRFSVPMAEGEITDRNNSALIQLNGVRDRLRVLLVSGEPHAGSRTWRNLLKSDSSVDLVHFTILRPPEKQDGVPVNELSLIAFPTRELFLEKIDDFDLIIFDRYKRRGILPSIYLDNVARYVEDGGAVLIAAGPDFATASSIYRSPLSRVLPAEPTARIIEERYLPEITETGQRHPVTAGLDPNWGAWMRQIELSPLSGQVVMSGVDEGPLMVLDRVGEGRVALLGSDHAWLWSRGFDGGGPQLDLLRRLAHWMMKEPELEEEALSAEAIGQTMRITRRTLGDTVGPLTITQPDGSEVDITLSETGPGQYQATFEGPEIGLYRLREGDVEAVIGLGPAAPREFEQTIATGDLMAPLIDTRRGGVMALEDGVPSLRDVREGRPAAGRGWVGLTPRGAYETRDITQTPLLPVWLALLLISGFVIAGWLREGRR